jgi:uncharacterized alkaline shock family protein YloU
MADEQGQQSAAAGRGGASPLQTEKGITTIADAVVTKVAGIATREVPGVHDLGGGAQRAFGAVTRTVGIGDDSSQGVSVEVGEREAAVDLVVVIEYGESVPDVTQKIRDNVIRRIEGICGLSVNEVNVAVNDLYLPGSDQDEDQQTEQRVQ